MSQQLTFTRPHRPGKLADELFAAFPTWRQTGPDGRFRTEVVVETDGDTIRLTVPEGTNPAAVQAVIDAHDPSTPSAGEQQEIADRGSLQELADQYQAGLTQLDATQAAMTAILNGPANPTLAQLTSAVRTVATEVRTLATVQERTLKALRVVLRQQGVSGP
jgi:hypothetical protein